MWVCGCVYAPLVCVSLIAAARAPQGALCGVCGCVRIFLVCFYECCCTSTSWCVFGLCHMPVVCV